MSTPIVSIIIPTYNRANLVEETLTSVLQQSYFNWECIIVDDGSNHETIEILKKYISKDKRFRLFKRPEDKPKGANACRNYGKQIASGEYLMFLDSDDLLRFDCLENRVKHMDNFPQYDMLVFSMGHFINNADNCYIDLNRRVINLSIEDTIFEFILGSKLPWNVTRPFFKSNLIKEIDFNENIQNFQDDEFNLRLLSVAQPKYSSIDETDCYYRMDITNINKYDNLQGYQNCLNSLEVVYETVFQSLSKEQKEKHRNELIKKIFNQIDCYVVPGVDLKILKNTIKLFDQKLQLTIKEKSLLIAMINLNLYLYNRKGLYRLRKFLNKIFNK